MAVFMTPFEVAERLGAMFTEHTVRRLARQHGCFTRGPRRQMMFSEDNIQQLEEAIRNPPADEWWQEEDDPFKPSPRK